MRDKITGLFHCPCGAPSHAFQDGQRMFRLCSRRVHPRTNDDVAKPTDNGRDESIEEEDDDEDEDDDDEDDDEEEDPGESRGKKRRKVGILDMCGCQRILTPITEAKEIIRQPFPRLGGRCR